MESHWPGEQAPKWGNGQKKGRGRGRPIGGVKLPTVRLDKVVNFARIERSRKGERENIGRAVLLALKKTNFRVESKSLVLP